MKSKNPLSQQKLALMSALALAAISLTGCSLLNKDEVSLEQENREAAVLKRFETGNRLLDEKKFAEAARIFDSLLVDSPVSQMDNVILFNAGAAHLQNNDCTKAVDRFRRVVRMTDDKRSPLRARALLRLSDSYTCLGDDTKAIVNLIEAFMSREALPNEIGQAEVPARLAAAYARLGNEKEAQKYFKVAEKGLKTIQISLRDSDKQRELLGQTLFLMGNTVQLNTSTIDGEQYFATIRALQKYLYKAVEYNVGTWSDQAAAQIIEAYQNSWAYLEKAKAGQVSDAVNSTDPALADRERRLKQVRVAQVALDSLKSLWHERIPDPTEPARIAELFEKVKTQETRLRNFIATNIVGTDLSLEALQAETLRKAGRVLNPDPILEETAARRSRVKKKPSKNGPGALK